MGLVSSTDMAPQYQCRIADGKSEEFKSDILKNVYGVSRILHPAATSFLLLFFMHLRSTLRTFSAQLPGWTDTPCLVRITTAKPRYNEPRFSEIPAIARWPCYLN